MPFTWLGVYENVKKLQKPNLGWSKKFRIVLLTCQGKGRVCGEYMKDLQHLKSERGMVKGSRKSVISSILWLLLLSHLSRVGLCATP